MDITLKLKELREEVGISQEQLAAAMNTTRMTLAGYENGKRFPDAEFLLKICDYFKCTPNYLFGLTPFKNEKGFTEWITSVDTLQQALSILSDSKRNTFIATLNFLLADNYNTNKLNIDRDYMIDKFIELADSFASVFRVGLECHNESATDITIRKEDILDIFKSIEKEKTELFDIIKSTTSYLFEVILKQL